MRTRYTFRQSPRNVAHVAATLYRDDDPAEPIADIFDPAAVLHLAAAPRMAEALRRALALLRDPDAEARDADLCTRVIEGALAEAGELPAAVTPGAGCLRTWRTREAAQAVADWLNAMSPRPVYSAQCYSYRVARAACGLRPAPGTGRTARPIGPPGAGLTTFRARPPDRTDAGQRLRDEVAGLVRMERAVLRLVAGVCPCGPPVDSLLLATAAPPPPQRPTPYRAENLARSNFSQEITV